MAGNPPTHEDHASGPELMPEDRPAARAATERTPDPYGPPPPPPPIPRLAARQAPKRGAGGAVTAIIWSLLAVLVIGGAAAAYFVVLKRARYEGEWKLVGMQAAGTEIDIEAERAKLQAAGAAAPATPTLVLKPDGVGEVTGGVAGGGGSLGAPISREVAWAKTKDGITVTLPSGLGSMGAAMGVPESVDAVGALEDGKLKLTMSVLGFETVMVFEKGKR